MISDIPGHAEGHEALGAFNMDIELRNKLEAAARDAQKLATEAEQKTAALQSDHDSIKAALETERATLEAKSAELASAQSAAADAHAAMAEAQTKCAALESKCVDLQAQLDAATAPKAGDLAQPPEAQPTEPKAPEENTNAADVPPSSPPAA